MIKTKYNCYLTLQFLDNIEYQQGLKLDTEKVVKAQENAIDKLEELFNKNNINLEIGIWEGNTNLVDGYVEKIEFTMVTDVPLEYIFTNVYAEIQCLKQDIDYCYDIGIRDAEVINKDEILEEIKEQLLNKTITIDDMVEIMNEILGYNDDGEIEKVDCVDKYNSYSFEYRGLYVTDFIIDICWDVIEMKASLYDRVIKVTDINLL
jgi:hypothetical protein